jgi:hypothetical protein
LRARTLHVSFLMYVCPSEFCFRLLYH